MMERAAPSLYKTIPDDVCPLPMIEEAVFKRLQALQDMCNRILEERDFDDADGGKYNDESGKYSDKNEACAASQNHLTHCAPANLSLTDRIGHFMLHLIFICREMDVEWLEDAEAQLFKRRLKRAGMHELMEVIDECELDFEIVSHSFVDSIQMSGGKLYQSSIIGQEQGEVVGGSKYKKRSRSLTTPKQEWQSDHRFVFAPQDAEEQEEVQEDVSISGKYSSFLLLVDGLSSPSLKK